MNINNLVRNSIISIPQQERGMAWLVDHGPLVTAPPLPMAVLRALVRRERILRLRRGLYLVPDVTGRLPGIAETITLVDPDGYISGHGALGLMGLNDQDVGRWYSVSPRELAGIAYGPLAVHFVHSVSALARAKTTAVSIAGCSVRLATIAQALIDEIDLMPWGLDYPETVRVMRNALDAGRVNERELLAVWRAHPSIAAARRLGFTLELATGRASAAIAAIAHRDRGITGPTTGRLDLAWRLRLPASREDIAGASR
jgi:predicted transcriptional regulator of viral defense system